MPTFQSPVDSTTLFYRYYVPDSIAYKPEPGPISPLTLVFLHGWPLSSRMFDQLIVPLCETYRFRCVAPDRRGFGNSDWNTSKSKPITFDTFIADAVGLLEHLDLDNIVFICASMGASESVLCHRASSLVRKRCRGFAWIGANMPYSVQSPESPAAPAEEAWNITIDNFRASTGKQFISDQIPGIFRTDLGNDIGMRTLQFFERLVGQADPLAIEKTSLILRKQMVKEIRELAEGEKIPIFILHGDNDKGMPFEATSKVLHEMLPWSKLKLYQQAGHGWFWTLYGFADVRLIEVGLYLTHAGEVLQDLVEFLRSIPTERQGSGEK